MGSGYLKNKKQSKALQQQMSAMQEKIGEELERIEITGKAPNNLVEITLKGSYEMLEIKINPECVDPKDVEGLEALVKAAYEDAHSKIKEKTESPEAFSSFGSFSSLFG